ncbi:MAG: hypothetical protein ACOC44_20670, partial [Promethearchaeia archaeon]
YLTEIARRYSDKKFLKNNISTHLLANEDIQHYADNLKRIIEQEKLQDTKKIILDMTPGRKYMSAINVFYGLQNFDIPIQVFYLHLEESRYQDIAFPLTPIIKTELVDIIGSTEIFTQNFEDLETQSEQGNTGRMTLKEFIKTSDKVQNKKENLILLAISRGLTSKSKIRGFLYNEKKEIRRPKLRQILKKLESRDLIKSQKIENQSTEYTGFLIKKKGQEKLEEFKEEIKNE